MVFDYLPLIIEYTDNIETHLKELNEEIRLKGTRTFCNPPKNPIFITVFQKNIIFHRAIWAFLGFCCLGQSFIEKIGKQEPSPSLPLLFFLFLYFFSLYFSFSYLSLSIFSFMPISLFPLLKSSPCVISL